MTAAPFNPQKHDELIAQSYAYTRIPADWEDVGNGETGPMIDGHPDYDQYEKGNEYIVIDQAGDCHGPYPMM